MRMTGEGISSREYSLSSYQRHLNGPRCVDSLNEEVGADVEEGGQLLGLRFADGTLAVEYLGGNSFGAEDSPEVLLRQITGLHQVPKDLLRAGFADGIAALFIPKNAFERRIVAVCPRKA